MTCLINSIVTPNVFSTRIWQRKMIFYLVICHTDVISTGIGQRKVAFFINSFVTPDAFSTGIGQRKVAFLINSINP